MNNDWKTCITVTAAIVLAAAWSAGAANAQRAARRPAAANTSAVRAAIEAGNKKFSDGAAKHDAAMLVTAYTVDAEAFPPNSEMVKGRPALQKLWQSVMDSGVAGVELTTTEVEAAGSLAYEVGTYTMKTKDGAVADRGKYCVVWKRVNGEWLLHRDIWSTSLPETKK